MLGIKGRWLRNATIAIQKWMQRVAVPAISMHGHAQIVIIGSQNPVATLLPEDRLLLPVNAKIAKDNNTK